MGNNSLIKTLKIKSTIDGSIEENFFIASKQKNSPLLVKLHTWSCGKKAEIGNIKEIYRLTGWNILCPEFRGPNLKENIRAKEACGSKLAMQDIIDAIYTIKKEYKFKYLFLFGGSGGGHMALMMAGYKPKLWTAVCAWSPITNLNTWRFQNPKYRPHIEACADKEYHIRSPINYIDKIADATVYIFHGKDDKSVPFAQSLNFYNKIIRKYPYANIFFNIFKGGHEIKVKETIGIFKSYLYNKSTAAITLTN